MDFVTHNFPSSCYHSHFIIRIFHPHFIIRHPPSAIRYPPSAIRHPPSAVRSSLYRDPVNFEVWLSKLWSLIGRHNTIWSPLWTSSCQRWYCSAFVLQLSSQGFALSVSNAWHYDPSSTDSPFPEAWVTLGEIVDLIIFCFRTNTGQIWCCICPDCKDNKWKCRANTVWNWSHI